MVKHMKTKEEVIKNAVSDVGQFIGGAEDWVAKRIRGAWESGYRNGENDTVARMNEKLEDVLKAEREKIWNEGYNAGLELAKQNDKRDFCMYCEFLNGNEYDLNLPCRTCTHNYTNNFKQKADVVTNGKKFREVFGIVGDAEFGSKWWDTPYREPDDS